MIRVYIPASVSILAEAVDSQQVSPIGGTAFGVTDSLRAEYPGTDEEELEYLALRDAARAALRLLPADGPPLRVVIAVDVDVAAPTPDRDRAAVRLSSGVPWRAVVAVHVDGADAAESVQAAAAVIDQADLGDLDAEFVVGEAESYELAWYAPDEVSFLVTELG